MVDIVDVDNIWRNLGPFKKYTVLQIIYAYFVCVFSVSFPMIVYVFVGHIPPHKCKPLTKDLADYGLTDAYNTSYNVLTYESCNTVLSVNRTNVTIILKVPCVEGYDYDTQVNTFVTEWNLVCDHAGLGELTQTIWMAGQAFGCILFPSIADRFGRKHISVICFILMVSFGFAAAFGNYLIYIILRFITGALQQGAGLTIVILVIEQIPAENRGLVNSLGSLAWGTAMVVVAGIGYFMRDVDWRYIQMASALIGIHTFASYWIFDESIRWLIANKKCKEAKSIIKKIAKINKVNPEKALSCMEVYPEREPLTKKPLDEVPKSTEDFKKENIFTLLQHRTLLKTTIIMSFAWMTNAVVYYGLLLTSTQLAGDRYLNFFINVGVEIPAMVSFVLMVKRFPRKYLSVFYHSIAGASLVISVILTTQKDKGSGFETAAVAFSFIGKFGITGSFSTIFLWTPELYPTNLRNIGLGLASIVARAGGMFAPYATTLATYIEWGPGIIFGVCCVISTLLQLLLPETRGKELPQSVQEMREWDEQRKKTKVNTDI